MLLQYVYSSQVHVGVAQHSLNFHAAQRISAEGHSKVQLQLILHANNTQVNFHFIGPNPKGDRDKVSTHAARLLVS